jgi:hypothetical protein
VETFLTAAAAATAERTAGALAVPVLVLSARLPLRLPPIIPGRLFDSSVACRSSRFTASAKRRYVSTLAITTRRSTVRSSIPRSETRT